MYTFLGAGPAGPRAAIVHVYNVACNRERAGRESLEEKRTKKGPRKRA